MKVMVNSIPKGGTHLLLKLVYLLGIPDDPKRFWLGAGIIRQGFEPLNKVMKGSYSSNTVMIGSESPVSIGTDWLIRKLHGIPENHSFGAHCLHSKKLSELLHSCGITPVCILRDPRAIAASHMHYIKTWKKHFLHSAYMNLPSDIERMRFSISGGKLGKTEVKPMRERYEKYIEWMNDTSAAFVKFEDLIGEQGGGSEVAQKKAILKISNHLNVSLSESEIPSIQSNLFGKHENMTTSTTFRKGRVDAWRDELDSELISIVEENLKDILIKFQYLS